MVFLNNRTDHTTVNQCLFHTLQIVYVHALYKGIGSVLFLVFINDLIAVLEQ